VEAIGRKQGVFSFRTKRETGTRSWSKVEKYFCKVGSSNPRHFVRFLEYAKGNAVYKKDVLKYYPKYDKIELPFKGP